MLYKYLIRPLLFLLPPERAHHFSFTALKIAFKIPLVPYFLRKNYSVSSASLTRRVFGLEFSNPVGLAAGFDKDARLIDELSTFGFGFIEIGTVTPVGQSGNEQPRLFRLPKDSSLINRLGFNNEGLSAVVRRLKKRKSSIIIGGNIGKNKVTPNESAFEDYLKGFHELYDHVDYFVVNVSSPNTPGLRELQEKEPLTRLLGKIKNANNEKPAAKPILLKIAPDLTTQQLDDILDIVKELKIDGIIATNTTIDRSNLDTPKSDVEAIGPGGLSGLKLREKSTEMIRSIAEKTKGELPIIGVGGIFNATDVKEKLDAGATLVQVYTGFVYEGPGMIARINRGLRDGTK
jgi:dihydroorotate dehydrogenase